MTGRYLMDSDVLIDLFRGRPEAVSFFHEYESRPMISVITAAELFSGVRDGSERVAVETFLRRSVLIEVDEPTAISGGLLFRQYHRSHGTGLADALIAATSQLISAPLITLNRRHFPMLTDIHVPYVRA